MLHSGSVTRMRARLTALVATIAVAGCATASPAPRAADPPARTPYVLRCSPEDPERGAWYCAIGHLLYAVAAMMQPEVGLIRP